MKAKYWFKLWWLAVKSGMWASPIMLTETLAKTIKIVVISSLGGRME